MARLRNRILKADFWSDGELLRWPREKRMTYAGLYATAEDSGCLEDDPFMWKCLLWTSPLDADITVEKIEQWRDELVDAGKLIPYVVEGRDYLYIKSFHEHERPRNPQSPNVPLPAWVTFVPMEGREHRGHYEVEEFANGNGKAKRALPAPKKGTAVAKRDQDDEGFDVFWALYPRGEDKVRARRAWGRLTKAEKELATGVAQVMGVLVERKEQEKRFVPHPSTFLNNKRWEDWREGIPAGWISQNTEVANENAASIDAAIAAAGLTGGEG